MPLKRRTEGRKTDSIPVRDHLLWSLLNLAYMNVCCIGFVALVFSVKSRDRKVMGDVEGAQHYASKARALNIAAHSAEHPCLGIFIALASAGVLQVMKIQQQHHDSFGGGK
ncbi:dispanin subfamily A member 2b-like [Heterodontus francisci]|uniref:dispanin subfamily A member 2b-like n=1 Tax=Heterodontus francisci TaxID=7792 RepID=UPI00355C2450